MARWCGKVGYVSEQTETSPGVWKDTIVERIYKGDAIKLSSRWSGSSDSVNDDITIDNQISIVADPFAYQNFTSMKYVEFMGAKWKITNIEVRRPRLILTIGGLYNAKQG